MGGKEGQAALQGPLGCGGCGAGTGKANGLIHTLLELGGPPSGRCINTGAGGKNEALHQVSNPQQVLGRRASRAECS